MHLYEQRTCEALKKKYGKQNLFELINYAISVAENIIDTEREPKVKSPIDNPSYSALEEIANGVDVIEPKKEKPPEPVAEETAPVEEEKPKRKILKNLRTIDKS